MNARRPARWLRKLRVTRWRVLLVLQAAFAALALGVARTVTGVAFDLLWLPVFLGVLLGWALGASRLKSRVAAPAAVLLGLPLILFQVGNLGPPLLAFARSLLRFVVRFVHRFLRRFLRGAVVEQAWPDAGPVVERWTDVTGAVGILLRRLAGWALALAQGEAAFDPVATAVLWLAALFAAAAWAGWATRRRNRPLRALLPAMMLLAAALTVTGGSALYLIPAVGLALVLRANAAHVAREEAWRREEITFSRRFRRDVTWMAAGLALVLMVLALIAPSVSIYRLADFARDLGQQDEGDGVAGSLGLRRPAQAPPVDVFVGQRRGGLPARHLIGSGPELSEQPVMAVTVEEPEGVAGRLRYWRAITYDRYTGRGWETTGTTTVRYEAGEPAGAPWERERQQPVRLEVRGLAADVAESGTLLHAAGTIVTVDRDFQIAWRARYRQAGVYTDFFAASLAGARPGDGSGDRTPTYRVDARVPLFSEAELRDVALEIPAWMVEYYLALPAEVSDRVRTLARDLTVTEPTPYDRALAIERHLRTFPYTLDLPAPPAGKEIADYFLFELQRGYCDYYATTMVVLARAAGLPARLATGYVGGTFDGESNRYTVTADLAHSWPELYFPDYGWIPFEPTAGREAIERPAVAPPDVEEEAAELEPITAGRTRALWRRALWIGSGLLLAAAVVFLGRLSFDLWRLRSLPPERALRRLFAHVQRGGERIEVRPATGETAYEFAGRLKARLRTTADGKRGAQALASAPETVDWLTDLYVRSLFSRHGLPAEQQGQAIGRWLRLHLQLWWAVLLLRLKKVAGRAPKWSL